ncbi:MAG: hypothetical protein H5T86_09820 [Armatimonadetes bacterium]|nr:hypothetical protein [Armatimonadota bacterium]
MWSASEHPDVIAERCYAHCGVRHIAIVLVPFARGHADEVEFAAATQLLVVLSMPVSIAVNFTPLPEQLAAQAWVSPRYRPVTRS